jgi:nucleoside-diphosphate-sugar epimerase
MESSEVVSIGPSTDWSSALIGIDVVIHLAGRVHVEEETVEDSIRAYREVNTAGTVRLARMAAEQGVRRIVFLSTVGVHGNSSSSRGISEQDESAPHDAYTLSKWEAEQDLSGICADTGLERTVIRCPLVYGPGNPGNFLRLLGWVQRGIPLPLANVRNERSMIFVENVVHAILCCATHPQAAGQTYLVCDGENVSTPELIRRIAQALDRPARLLPFPPAWLRTLGKWTGRARDVERLLGTMIIDNSKIRKELNWKPPCSISEGIQVTAAWYRRRFSSEG